MLVSNRSSNFLLEGFLDQVASWKAKAFLKSLLRAHSVLLLYLAFYNCLWLVLLVSNGNEICEHASKLIAQIDDRESEMKDNEIIDTNTNIFFRYKNCRQFTWHNH